MSAFSGSGYYLFKKYLSIIENISASEARDAVRTSPSPRRPGRVEVGAPPAISARSGKQGHGKMGRRRFKCSGPLLASGASAKERAMTTASKGLRANSIETKAR